jgi:hypothetical protein
VAVEALIELARSEPETARFLRSEPLGAGKQALDSRDEKGETWPQRWHAGEAFARYLENEPLRAHIGFIEAYCAGPMAVQRVEDNHTAFTLFLQEGYRPVALELAGGVAEDAANEDPPGRLALEAVITAIYEMVCLELRGGRTGGLSRTLGLIAAVFLTPFLGGANAFVDA